MASGGDTISKLAAVQKSLEAERSATQLPWIQTARADTFFGIVIFLNVAFIGIDIEVNQQEFNWTFWIIESIFLGLFLVEVTMRLQAAKPKRSFFDAWGVFDCTVTIMGCVDAWFLTFVLGKDEDSPFGSLIVLRVLRLVRLVRLLRVLRMFNELVVLVTTITSSMKAISWMSLLLGMIMYTGSILLVMLVGLPYKDSDEEVAKHFGSVGGAIFAHFCVVTLEGWTDVAAAAMTYSPLWAVYFIGMIVLTNFCLVNLMIGVIVEKIISVAQEQEQEIASFVSESEQFKETLRTLFDCADMDGSGEVTREEVRELLKDRRTHAIMSAFGINVKMPPAVLHTIMDISHDGPTTFDEFFENCIRLSGSKANVHSIFVQHDICAAHQDLKKTLQLVEESVNRASSRMAGSATMPSKLLAPAAPALPTVLPPAPLQLPPQENISSEATRDIQEVAATVNQMLERMEQFSFVQQHIMAELHALKEHTRMSGAGGGDIRQSSPPPFHQSGKDLGNCCAADSIYDRPTSVSVAVSGGRLGGFCSVNQEQKANAQPIPASLPKSGLGERKLSSAEEGSTQRPGTPLARQTASARMGQMPVSADQVRKGFQAEFSAKRNVTG